MMNSDQRASSIGRANTILVFGSGDNAKAVFSAVVVKTTDKGIGDRIRFSGPATFEEKTINHIKRVILAVVDGICKMLGLVEKNFDLSVVNLGAASAIDVSFTVSGYSADAPICLAMLSACLEMSTFQDVAVTGHIASTDGDIRMVGSIPAKLDAAIKEEDIDVFIHPSFEKDRSLGSLSPVESERNENAIRTAKSKIRVKGVGDLYDLVRETFSDDQIVLASLKSGFYEASDDASHTDSWLEKAANYLKHHNKDRFWKSLEQQLMEGRNKEAHNLLNAMVNFYQQHKRYPENLGNRLLQLIQSLPPETRRLKVEFPLISMAKCINIAQFGAESDHKDVKPFFEAISGEIGRHLVRTSKAVSADEPDDSLDRGHQILLSIQSEISVDALVSITHPIDLAWATYCLGSIIIETSEEFDAATTAYFIHLKRHTRKISEPMTLRDAGAEALDLLERSFAQNGGSKSAFVEAKSGTRGGLSHVLTKMANQYKKEEVSKHVNWVLKSTLDPLDFDTKTAVVKALMEDIGPHLPADIADQPPEKFSNFWDTIIRTYSESMQQVSSLFRSL